MAELSPTTLALLRKLNSSRRNKYWSEHQAYLPRVRFDLQALARKVHLLFPTVPTIPDVAFYNQAALAWIRSESLEVDKPTIAMHRILNHETMPAEPIEGILIHEFCHLVIPSRDIDGKITKHPPEFWELEEKLNPDNSALKLWSCCALMGALRCDEEAEGIFVKPGWKKWFDQNFTNSWTEAVAWIKEDRPTPASAISSLCGSTKKRRKKHLKANPI